MSETTPAEPQIERMLPLYEAKMIHHYDYRWATFEADGNTRNITVEEKQNPAFTPLPRYWVRESAVKDSLGELSDLKWLFGFRDVTNSTNERTVIASMFPLSAVGHTLPVIIQGIKLSRFISILSSFALDFLARPKIGGIHLTFFIANQLPILEPKIFEQPLPWGSGSIGHWVDARTEELFHGKWLPERRELLRAELDAAFFHLYGINGEDVDYIMETFPIVKRKDEAAYGEYRTKRLILERYSALAEAIQSGIPYQTPLDPPPASPAQSAAG